MKLAASLLLPVAALVTLSSCTTLANRRDLYRPKSGSGYWTDHYAKHRRGEGIFGVSNNHHQAPGHVPGRDEGIFGISHNEDMHGFRAD